MAWFVYVKSIGGDPEPQIWHAADRGFDGKPYPCLFKIALPPEIETLSLKTLSTIYPYQKVTS
jgi:hypothetical protein